MADERAFAAPDQLATRLAEVLPAADRMLAGAAVFDAVPPFHGVNAPAIADREAANRQRLAANGERLGRGEDLVVDRKIGRQAVEIVGKLSQGAETANPLIVSHQLHLALCISQKHGRAASRPGNPHYSGPP